MASSSRKRRKRRPSGEYQPPARRPSSAGPAERRSGGLAAGGRGSRRAGRDRPPAPWGSFPLVELVVLFAIVLLVAGFLIQEGRGVIMIAAGLALGSLAGLELAVREHLAGYRSHSTVLAGALAIVVLAGGFFLLPAGGARLVGLIGSAVTFGVAFYLLREAFKRRSGGVGWR